MLFFFLSLFQIQILNRDLTNYQKRERELLGRLCPAAEKSISEMVQQMEEQYRNLLDCHLAQLRSTYLSSLPSTNNAESASSSSNTATSTSTDSPVATQAIVEPGQTESNNTVDYHATAVATTLQSQEQDVEVNGTDDVEVLHQRQQQEQLAYIANKVVARLQAANSHNGQVHDDIVIITSSDDPGHHTQEEGVVNSEPLIICTSTVEEAALEQTVSCHTSEHTEETTTVVHEGDSLDATVAEDIKEASGTQVQVLSIIHTSSASQDTADEQQKHDGELPPSKRLRTET